MYYNICIKDLPKCTKCSTISVRPITAKQELGYEVYIDGRHHVRYKAICISFFNEVVRKGVWHIMTFIYTIPVYMNMK